MAIIMNGKEIAHEIKENIRKEIIAGPPHLHPKLAVVLVGDDPASQVYVRNKKKDCEECGIICDEYRLDKNTSEVDLLHLIEHLNNNRSVHGILIQLPLPSHINEQRVIMTIDPNKDVDCFHPINIGKLFTGAPVFNPCTPYGIITLLKEYKINVSGMNCVVIGRSNIVGKPMAAMLMQLGGTVTTCHTQTRYIKNYTRNADLIVSAVGKRNFLTADMVKYCTAIVDVGINRGKDGKLCGDVDFDELAPKCSYITPVPGGVGVMTRAMLMQNTLLAAKIMKDKT